MEIGSAYRFMKPRLEAVIERSPSPEFKAEAAEVIDNFERIKSLDGLKPSMFGLKPGDECEGHGVMVSDRARLWDRGDKMDFFYHTETCTGLGESLSRYGYDEHEGKVYVEKHRDCQRTPLSLFGPTEMQQSFTLDLVTGTITDLSAWTETVYNS